MKTIVVAFLIVIPAFMAAQQGNYGVGIIFGFPTGFSGAIVLSPTSVVAVHAGWSFQEDFGFHATGTYQFMFPSAIRTEKGKAIKDVVPYLGVGGRLILEERDGDNKVHVGVRIGGGIEYFVSQFGFFLELFPVVDVMPETEMDFEGGVGARIYF